MLRQAWEASGKGKKIFGLLPQSCQSVPYGIVHVLHPASQVNERIYMRTCESSLGLRMQDGRQVKILEEVRLGLHRRA